MNRRRTAVLISGRGSNMMALVNAASNPNYPAEIVLVMSDSGAAGGLALAEAAGIPTLAVDRKSLGSKAAFETALAAGLAEANIDLVCLAGFMRILSADFVNEWEGRMINIHPSILPAFRGIDTHQRAIDAGVKLHGCTVHFVRPDLDAGPIIAQAAIPVIAGDTAETLADRLLPIEHRIFPRALELVASGRARIDGDVVLLDDPSDEPGGYIISPALPRT